MAILSAKTYLLSKIYLTLFATKKMAILSVKVTY